MSRESFTNPFSQGRPHGRKADLMSVTSQVLGETTARRMRRVLGMKRIHIEDTQKVAEDQGVGGQEERQYIERRTHINELVEEACRVSKQGSALVSVMLPLRIAPILHAAHQDIEGLVEEPGAVSDSPMIKTIVFFAQFERIRVLAKLGYKERAEELIEAVEQQKSALMSESAASELLTTYLALGRLPDAVRVLSYLYEERVVAPARMQIASACAKLGRTEEAQTRFAEIKTRFFRAENPPPLQQMVLMTKMFDMQCEVGFGTEQQLEGFRAQIAEEERRTAARVPEEISASLASAALYLKNCELANAFLQKLFPHQEYFDELCVRYVCLLREQGRVEEAKEFIASLPRWSNIPERWEGDLMFTGLRSRLFAELGELEEAERLLDVVRKQGSQSDGSFSMSNIQKKFVLAEATLVKKLTERLMHGEE